MEERQARELGEALAFLMGDERDEPLRCGWCESTLGDADLDYRNNTLFCASCRRQTTMYYAAEMRTERLRKRIEQGVGGPLLSLRVR